MLFIVCVELCEFLLVGRFKVPLPGADFCAPDDLCLVFGVQENVGVFGVFSAVEVCHVNAVYFEEQKFVGCDEFVHSVESFEDLYCGIEVFKFPYLSGRRDICGSCEAFYIYDWQAGHWEEIEDDEVFVDVDGFSALCYRSERFSPVFFYEQPVLCGTDGDVIEPGDEFFDVLLDGGCDILVEY